MKIKTSDINKIIQTSSGFTHINVRIFENSNIAYVESDANTLIKVEIQGKCDKHGLFRLKRTIFRVLPIGEDKEDNYYEHKKSFESIYGTSEYIDIKVLKHEIIIGKHKLLYETKENYDISDFDAKYNLGAYRDTYYCNIICKLDLSKLDIDAIDYSKKLYLHLKENNNIDIITESEGVRFTETCNVLDNRKIDIKLGISGRELTALRYSSSEYINIYYKNMNDRLILDTDDMVILIREPLNPSIFKLKSIKDYTEETLNKNPFMEILVESEIFLHSIVQTLNILGNKESSIHLKGIQSDEYNRHILKIESMKKQPDYYYFANSSTSKVEDIIYNSTVRGHHEVDIDNQLLNSIYTEIKEIDKANYIDYIRICLYDNMCQIVGYYYNKVVSIALIYSNKIKPSYRNYDIEDSEVYNELLEIIDKL